MLGGEFALSAKGMGTSSMLCSLRAISGVYFARIRSNLFRMNAGW